MSRTPNPAALALAAALAAAVAFSHEPTAPGPAVIHPDETHFANLRQLTFGGQNAEGYWSPDGTRIIYQRMNEDEGVMCDQAYVLDLAAAPSTCT